MKKETYYCDIKGEHGGAVSHEKIPVMFDHDQEDGRSKVKPYFETKQLDICRKHLDQITSSRVIPYAYGAMGHNTYTI